MRKIYRFQMYSQQENWITNNTLLFLSLLYDYNQNKFEVVLNEIMDESIISVNVGVQFLQQEKSVKSVFDGTIEQKSFKIAIEAKKFDDFNLEQIYSHIQGLNEVNCENKILLIISKNEIPSEVRETIINYIDQNNFEDVKIASTSYEKLISIVDEQINDYEYEFKETISEYLAFCEENDLINRKNITMLVLAGGKSLAENLKYNIFYDPAERANNLPFKYLGLYHDKVVSNVGEVKKIVQCDLSGNDLKNNDTAKDELTKNEIERIKNIITETKYYNIKTGHKFYIVDKFYETNFIKKSFSSLRSKKYFFLYEIEKYGPEFDAQKLADYLRDKEWE